IRDRNVTGVQTCALPISEQDVAGGGYNHWATAGFFGRLNYNYKEKYLLEVNGRYDGTSRFMKDQRWNFFPSFSLGWNVARENFRSEERRVGKEWRFWRGA